jgi:hypothetical protein
MVVAKWIALKFSDMTYGTLHAHGASDATISHGVEARAELSQAPWSFAG